MKLDNFSFLEYSDYWPHLYCYTQNISANRFFGFLQVFYSNQMVSLDVVSLFTKVLIDKTLTVIQDKLATDPLQEECTCIPIDNLMGMLTFCVETTHFGTGSYI